MPKISRQNNLEIGQKANLLKPAQNIWLKTFCTHRSMNPQGRDYCRSVKNMRCSAIDKKRASDKIYFTIFFVQVNLCQKLLFLHQLTHNMTTDCSLNYKFNTWKFQAQTWGEHVVYRNCFWHSEQFFYTTCSPHVLQIEELLTKIYLYLIPNYNWRGHLSVDQNSSQLTFKTAESEISSPNLGLSADLDRWDYYFFLAKDPFVLAPKTRWCF